MKETAPFKSIRLSYESCLEPPFNGCKNGHGQPALQGFGWRSIRNFMGNGGCHSVKVNSRMGQERKCSFN